MPRQRINKEPLERIADALEGIEDSLDMFFGFDEDSASLDQESMAEKSVRVLEEIKDTLRFMSTGSNHQPGPVERISMMLERIKDEIASK